MDSGQRLRQVRLSAGLSQSELARRAGISRQALSAIESGAYQPGVTVALRLAAELGTTVENLFDGARASAPLVARTPANAACAAAARVALARIGGRLVAVPLPAAGVALTAAGGIVARELRGSRVEVEAFRSAAEIDSTLVISGCDPGIAVVRDYLARHQPFAEIVPVAAASRDALTAVAQGDAHAAGVHLRDPATGDYNVAAARAVFGRRTFRMISFARWELGMATRPDAAPLSSIDDLARPGLRLINRPPGSGARAVLDEMLAAGGIRGADLAGYGDTAAGHLEVAAAIAAGAADAGVTIRLAAELYHLNFAPWREERYDLVIGEEAFALPSMQRFIDALNSRALAHEVAKLCAYDTTRMGTVAAL